MKKVHDVSIPISKNLVLWPDDPGIKMELSKKIEEGASSNVTELTMGLHSGTHIDAPYHFVENGIKVEDIPLDTMIGRVRVVEIPETYDLISKNVLRDLVPGKNCDRILFKTRNSGSWYGQDTFQEDYVAVSFEGAEYLAQMGVKLVGIDYLSIAPFNDIERVHQILLEAGIIIVEGLDLLTVSAGFYMMYCLPLKMIGVEASPARVILVEE